MRALSSILSRVAGLLPLFSLGAAYRKRKLTFWILVVCGVGLTGSTISIAQFLLLDVRTVELDLYGKPIAGAEINVSKGENNDEVSLSLRLSANLPPEDRGFSIAAPDQFVEKSVFCWGAKEVGGHHYGGQRWYSFVVEGGDRPACTLGLSGPVVSTSARDMDLTLRVSSERRPTFPVTVQVRNLELVAVSELTPQPTFKNAYVIQYLPLPMDENRLAEISMHIHDRERGSQAEFRIFLVGIAFGVFSSFMASFLYEIVRDLENRSAEGKKSSIIIP